MRQMLDFDNQQQADAFLRAPYHYENQLEVAPGQYNLRMASCRSSWYAVISAKSKCP